MYTARLSYTFPINLPMYWFQIVGIFIDLLTYTARWHSPPVYDTNSFVHLLIPNCGQFYLTTTRLSYTFPINLPINWNQYMGKFIDILTYTARFPYTFPINFPMCWFQFMAKLIELLVYTARWHSPPNCSPICPYYMRYLFPLFSYSYIFNKFGHFTIIIGRFVFQTQTIISTYKLICQSNCLLSKKNWFLKSLISPLYTLFISI